ncbi:MAG: hypothetical protein AAB710_00350 [Patescibacteria group bacterium]
MDISFFYQSGPVLLALSIGILIVTVFLVVVLVGVGWFFWRRIEALQKQTMSEEKSAEVEARRVLLDAHRQATYFIEEATAKAEEVLKSAAVVKETTVTELTKQITAISEQHQQYLKDASLKYVETYEHMAERAQEEYLGTLHAASQGMAKDAKQTLDMFETYLKEQTVGYKQAMEKKIEELRSQTNEYVNEYKKEKLKRVDKAIREIIVSVAKNVIARSITIKEHNELLIRALDQAKKESFFSHLDL